MIARIVIRSRRIAAYLLALALLCVLSWSLGNTGILINLEFFRPQIRLPYPEICALLAGGLGVVLLRPRFWEWDRVAGRRAAAVSSAVAVLGSTAPIVVVYAGALVLPAGSSIAWRLSNAVVISATIFTISPYVGSAVAGAAAILVYFVHGLVNNLWFDLEFLPVTRHPGDRTHWLAAGVLVVVAGFVHFRTRGATAWSQRMFARDE